MKHSAAVAAADCLVDAISQDFSLNPGSLKWAIFGQKKIWEELFKINHQPVSAKEANMRALAKRSWGFLVLGILFSLMCFNLPALVAEPVNIAIIAESATLVGKAIENGAKLAAEEINAKGGINGQPIKLTIYDDQFKSPEAVQAFQRAVYSDHANVVVGSWISEIALSLAPWAARLHTIYITTFKPEEGKHFKYSSSKGSVQAAFSLAT